MEFAELVRYDNNGYIIGLNMDNPTAKRSTPALIYGFDRYAFVEDSLRVLRLRRTCRLYAYRGYSPELKKTSTT